MKKNNLLLTIMAVLFLLVSVKTIWASDFDADQLVSKWKQAWMSKNINAYMSFYSDDFSSDGLNAEAWKQKKVGIFNKNKSNSINIEVLKLTSDVSNYKATVTFSQRYKCQSFSDFGKKTLRFQREWGEWKIVSETWTKLKDPTKKAAPVVKSKKTAIKDKLDIVTHLEGPMGNGSIEAYTIIGNFITKDYPNLILRPQETPGYLYNIREMATNKRRWKNTTFGSGETIINLAFTGGGSKALREFLPLKIDVQWKALWSTATSSAGLWYVTFDPDLKTVSDLKGKKIGLGLRTQSEFGMNAAFFLDQAYGINSSNTKIFFLGPMKMTNSLLDGKVDAICMGMVAANSAGIKRWLPSPPYLKLVASKRKLNYIPMDEWAITKINNRYGTTYQSETVKAGMLKDLTSDLKIGGNRLLTVVHPTFSDDLAYKYIMALANTAPKIKEYHPFWKYIWNLEGMVSGLSEENTHPGAIRAYKELGVWDKRHNYPPFDLANATRK